APPPGRVNELRATYRLQLGPGLGFREARELVPYLRDLGISHLYLSPSLQARSVSTHGYDVVDPTRISDDLGGEDEFRALCGAGLGVVLDIVPNHMAAVDENPFWRDPLWRAKFFDVDWRTGGHRRFFDVSELAGVRMEDPEVFEVTHSKVVELAREGLIDGVRVDHPDGLANPRRYLERLREAGIERVWVEKILEPGERLRDDWPVEGTTGYEFLNEVTKVFVDPAAEEPLTRLYEELTGARPYAEVAAEAKREQAATTFADEAAQLAAKLPFEADLAEALASLHVYRTYVDPESGHVADEDRAAIAEAGVEEELARILLLEERGHDAFVVRFQQTTPPVHAKGVEDTAFYRWNRFVALNEVGGDPGRFSLSVADFHAANAARPPGGLLATTTHDTKRSGDVRARLVAIADDPAGWEAVVRPRLGGWRDPNEAYLILQTVVGAWPLSPERLELYLEKALREAKLHTSWIDPEPEWEAGAKAWAVGLLRDEELGAYAERLSARAAQIVRGTTLLKLTVPGIPDVYQGDELPFLALVDPDNRRPVDFDARRRLLASASPPPKLDLISRTLALRGRRAAAFAGAYEPVEAGEDVVSFTRGGEVLVAVALRRDLGGFRTPAGEWADVYRTPELLLAERV
ncbi:MAG TPA: malto-oligosyltrehalose synthase, partial [Gaiella sp.]|nr:malto-oligosyltrehalose synthase [Gaiella sp.]